MSMLKQLYDAEELPYDKFMKFGPGSLSDAELLAIMLRTGTRDKTPIELGRAILNLSGSKWGLLGLHHFTIKELMKIPGIGEVKAVQLLCIAEIAKRISNMQAKVNLSFQNPDSVAAYYMERMRHRETEQLILILLDAKNRMIYDEVISVGILNATLISTREIFIKAFKEEAAYIMILHNHPSGDPTPSRQDQQITNKIKEVSILVDIPLIDHIIIGDNRYISFKQKGLL
ncbi:MAG: DNA repair protein RadC [Lachnospiraceae bacterium]|nr:DNA repair protein RadC [Lachnospiraceae bacterium]